MARDPDASCRRAAAGGTLLKGEKVFTDKCAIERRSYAPGQQARKAAAHVRFGKQLREKQKLRRNIRAARRQFRKTYAASRSKA